MVDDVSNQKNIMTLFYALLFKIRPSNLTQYLKKLFRIRRREVKTQSGLTLCVDPVSHFGLEVLTTGTYESAMTSLVSTLLRSGDVFVDAGANEGYFSILASKFVESGRVFSVEPQSRLIPVIEKNTRLNDCKNISLHHLALSNRTGEIELHLSPDTNSGASSLFRRPNQRDVIEIVKADTLDRFIIENCIEAIRFMKIDCEGAEKVIVEGALATLKDRRIEFIVVEFHMNVLSESEVMKLDAIIRSFGYNLSETGGGLWVYHLPGLEVALRPLGDTRQIAPLAARGGATLTA